MIAILADQCVLTFDSILIDPALHACRAVIWEWSCHAFTDGLAYWQAQLVANLESIANYLYLPLLRNDAHLGLLVAGLHFHDAPIFLRCSLTRAASVSTSSMSFGSGVA